ncbi:MAG: methyltransferase domain-containing protein [Pseudohongiellaceae bacterium]
MSFIAKYKARWQRRHELPEPTAVYRQMAEWLQTPLGQALLASEKQILEPLLARVFGYHILQLGCSNQSMLDESPVGHKILFVPSQAAGSDAPIASNEALPLMSESVDAVLVHHALDFTPDSYRLLREAARVVMPGGKLLIVGFNPLSTWGFRKLFRWRNDLPWNARFISSLRVSDWLKLLDFKIDKVEHGAYMLPFNHQKMVNSGGRLESLGRRFAPPAGAVYVIVACKQVMPVTLVMPRWPRIPRPVIVRPVGETAGARRGLRQKQARNTLQ